MLRSGANDPLLFLVAEVSLRLASVRYRALLPQLALRSGGFATRCITGAQSIPRGNAHIHAIKSINARDSASVERAIDSGRTVVMDLCDNIFVPQYGNSGGAIANRFASIAGRAAAVTVPTRALADIVAEAISIPRARVFVVPDIAEDAELLSAQAALIGAPLRDPPSRVVPGRVSGLVRAFLRRRAPRRLLWFGNHGANYASFGIRDLLQFADGLRRVARIAPLEVTVVSNNEERYREVAAQLGVPSRYREWSETAVDDELAHADLCLVPNSGDEFSRTKSPNRALKALAAGVPVVATATPSYGPLLDCTWTGDPGEGIERLLLDGAVRRAQLYRARSVIARHYSLPVLRDAMLEVLAAIGLPRAARA